KAAWSEPLAGVRSRADPNDWWAMGIRERLSGRAIPAGSSRRAAGWPGSPSSEGRELKGTNP
ncbi:hypothetical protein ACFL5O_09975, partial [Myxococcota bacterium]